jgi:molybdopterin converting factor small subunit
MALITVPTMLAAQAEGRQRFSIDGGTLGEALHALPVADLLFDERGDLHRHLNVYVDGIDARELGGLSSSLADAQEIRVVAMVSGG